MHCLGNFQMKIILFNIRTYSNISHIKTLEQFHAITWFNNINLFYEALDYTKDAATPAALISLQIFPTTNFNLGFVWGNYSKYSPLHKVAGSSCAT